MRQHRQLLGLTFITFFSLVTIVIFLLIVSSCCSRPTLTVYTLSDEEKLLLPYTDGQSITFLREDNSSLNFIVRRKYNFSVSTIPGGGERCPEGSNYDTDSVRFNPTDVTVLAEATYCFPVLLIGGERDYRLTPGKIRVYSQGQLSASHYSDANNDLEMPYDEKTNFVEGPNTQNDTLSFLGTVSINGKNYDQVYQLKEFQQEVPQFKLAAKSNYLEGVNNIVIWYNKTKGVLKYSYKYTKFVNAASVTEKNFEYSIKD